VRGERQTSRAQETRLAHYYAPRPLAVATTLAREAAAWDDVRACTRHSGGWLTEEIEAVPILSAGL
jgi:hypothetical protein